MKDYQPSDPSIKIFSYKGAFILAGICIIATAVVPYLLQLIGVDSKAAIVLSTSILGSAGICYVRNFIDSKNGFTKGLVMQFILFFIAFFMISYYWTFYQYYI